MVESSRGILYPERLPDFHRLPAPPALADLVQWFWIPEWDLAPGRTSRQLLLAYPSSNLVVQGDEVMLSGPTTRASHRDLTGRGWAVAWLSAQEISVSAEGRLANRLFDVTGSDPGIPTLDDAAEALAASPRTLQRVAKQFIGLSPAVLIRRRRLQEAAERVRSDPAAELAAIAADLGYTDHAHLTNEFRRVLGFTPSGYRLEISGPSPTEAG